MKKKIKKTKKQKKQVVYINEFDPVIDVGGDNWGATYYYDLSGEVFIGAEHEKMSFVKDDGGLKGQLEYIKEYMKDLTEAYNTDIKTCKDAIKTLKKELTNFKKKTFIIEQET